MTLRCAGFDAPTGKPCGDPDCMPCWWDCFDYEMYGPNSEFQRKATLEPRVRRMLAFVRRILSIRPSRYTQ